jgi:hypothetical protein
MISSFWEKLPLRGVVQNFDGVAVEDRDDGAGEVIARQGMVTWINGTSKATL